MQCEWISYAPGRRESWKCHHTRNGVRKAIAYGTEGLTLFSRGRLPGSGAVVFVEVPRENWEQLFGA